MITLQDKQKQIYLNQLVITSDLKAKENATKKEMYRYFKEFTYFRKSYNNLVKFRRLSQKKEKTLYKKYKGLDSYIRAKNKQNMGRTLNYILGDSKSIERGENVK